ncbi:unnamed protein product [Lathyrus sativus]|nr:unnamed protein product [Lathyrus sativus]
MRTIQNNDGTLITDKQEIHKEVMEFYGNLMGKAAHNLKHVDIEALRDGKHLNGDPREFLINTITEEEIVKSLKGIGDLKAPGIDGFGAKFFKVSWHIIKEDVIATIKEFFL